MTITVEDGTGSDPVANSYISVADAQAYLDDRSKTVTVTESLLLQAMGELNAQKWKGSIVATTQALSWPRSSVTDSEGRTILTTEVPSSIGYAQAFLAYHISEGNDPTAIATKKVIAETVDVISQTYSDKGGPTESVSINTIPEVKNLLKPYLLFDGYLGRA